MAVPTTTPMLPVISLFGLSDDPPYPIDRTFSYW